MISKKHNFKVGDFLVMYFISNQDQTIERFYLILEKFEKETPICYKVCDLQNIEKQYITSLPTSEIQKFCLLKPEKIDGQRNL